jgi:vacuolar-type H+-ATPase subunit E/Vma4
MSKVKDKILKDAEESKKGIEKETAAKIEKIKEEAKKEASKIKDKGKEEAKQEEKLETERIVARGRLDFVNKKLKKKNEIMESLKEKVITAMRNLKWEEYKLFVKKLILEASEEGEEEIIPGVLHREKVKELIEELNKEEKYKFKISEEKGDFEVGIILFKGKRRVNATLSVLLEEIFDRQEEEIVRTLFKSE